MYPEQGSDSPIQLKPFTGFPGSVAFPQPVPIRSGIDRLLTAAKLDQQQIAVRGGICFDARGDDSAKIFKCGPLRLIEIPAGDALIVGRQDPHHRQDHGPVTFGVVDPGEPERHRQSPDEQHAR